MDGWKNAKERASRMHTSEEFDIVENSKHIFQPTDATYDDKDTRSNQHHITNINNCWLVETLTNFIPLSNAGRR